MSGLNTQDISSDIVTAGKTSCNIKISDEGTRITLNAPGIYVTVCLTLPPLSFVGVSNNKLHITHNGEIKTFYQIFPTEPFHGFHPDLLNDIGGVRKEVKSKVPELM